MIVNTTTQPNTFFERTDTLQRYCEDIRKYKTLDVEYEKKLIKQYKTTTDIKEKQRIKDIILCANQRFILMVARRWGTNDNIMDLISEANIGMIEALDNFELNKDTKFISFAVYYVRRAINLYLIKHGSTVKKNNMSKTYHFISQATNYFMQRECRTPTPEELMNLLKTQYGVEIKDVNDVISLQMCSIDNVNNENDECDGNVGDSIDFNNVSSSFNNVEQKDNQEFFKKITQSVLTCLKENEKNVIKYYFGIEHNREHSVSEIAEKMCLSTERVRQIKISALEKIKNEYSKIIHSL